MADKSDTQIRVTLDGRKLSASLRLAKGLDTESLTVDVLRAMLTERGVRPTYINEELLKSLVERYDPEADEPIEEIVAEGKAPVDGQDARLEWDPEIQEQLAAIKLVRDAARARERGEEANVKASTDGDEAGSTVSHYDRSAYCTVEANQRLGRVVPPKDGEEGVNVLGEAIAPRAPSTQAFKYERTLTVDDEGVIRANVAGVLYTDQEPVRIDTDLRIDGFVDFSTGNISGFRGNVEVVKGIRDNFRVDIDGTLTVGELVEAARIATGGDLVLRRGMAGRDKGVIDVGKDAEAKFLDGISGTVLRDLKVGSELTGAKLRIGRNLLVPRGAILGGRVEVLGKCEASQLGSPAQSHQELILGHHADAEGLAARVAEVIPRVRRAREKTEERYKLLSNTGGKLSPAQAEELTELQMQLHMQGAKIEPLASGLRSLTRAIAARTNPSLVVHKVIHAGVVLMIGAWKVTFNTDVKGPISMSLDDSGSPKLKEPGSERVVALEQVADVVRTPEFPNLEDIRSLCDEILGADKEQAGLDDNSSGKAA